MNFSIFSSFTFNNKNYTLFYLFSVLNVFTRISEKNIQIKNEDKKKCKSRDSFFFVIKSKKKI